MNVGVVYASKHGSTREIAGAIGDRLRTHGFEVTVVDAAEAGALARFDAAVVGSALYMGRWIDAARAILVDRAELRGRPVWLFSSGPVGDPPKPTEPLTEIEAMMRQSGAREHKVFAGRLDRRELSFFEKAAVRVVRAPDGDFRNWSEIEAWADDIARTLTAGGPSARAELQAAAAR